MYKYSNRIKTCPLFDKADASHLVHIGAVRGEGGEEAGQGGAAVLLQDALQPSPGPGQYSSQSTFEVSGRPGKEL